MIRIEPLTSRWFISFDKDVFTVLINFIILVLIHGCILLFMLFLVTIKSGKRFQT